MTINDAAFQAALRDYAAASTRELPDVLNKVARDVGLTAAKLTVRADKEAIRILPHLDWWPKFVAVQMRKKFGGTLLPGQYREEARKMSRRLVGSRLSAVSFVASAFVKAANVVAPGSDVRIYSKRGTSKAVGYANRANAGQGDKQRATLTMQYGNQNPQGAATVGNKAMASAIEAKRADMILYITRKMQETGRRHSRRRS